MYVIIESSVVDLFCMTHYFAKSLHSAIQVPEFRCSTHLHGKIKHLGLQTASTSIERSGQELSELQRGTVTGKHPSIKSTGEMSFLFHSQLLVGF